VRAVLVFLSVFVLSVSPAFAQQEAQPGDEAQIRDVIAQWYAALQKRGPAAALFGGNGKWQLYAPGAIDGGPRETETNPQSRSLSPSVSNELAAKALKFAYEIDVLTVDPRFAKAIVWERGYFYAWAAQKTYENAASTLFIFEKQKDGRWLILAHYANSIGIPPHKITDPMPDLRDYFYETQGKGRDPAADAEEAKKF
jgi:hypothetical protein